MEEPVEFTLTEMLRESGKVLNAVELSSEVLLRRRDGADVLLVEADHERAIRHSLRTAAAVASASLEGPIEAVLERIVDRLPWIYYLPIEQKIEFLREFGREAAAAADTNVFVRLSQLERDWETSAHLYAAPGMREWLTGAMKIDEGFGRENLAAEQHACE